jgi:hypothetical protein
VTVAYAKEHLDDLIARVVRGDEIRIVHPVHGAFIWRPDTIAQRRVDWVSSPNAGQAS